MVDRIDLAHEPDIMIGPIIISPSMREITCADGIRAQLEHRVMQVLVALFRAGGTIVTRDELIDLCWDGRIVGDDAINRVISRLRKALVRCSAGTIRVETLNKIGYRLTCEAARGLPAGFGGQPAAPARTARRTILASTLAAGAIGLVAAGGWKWRKATRSRVPPEIPSLMSQARQLIGQNTREGQYQAIGLLRRVVEMAPGHADGWGQLGIYYGIVSHYRGRIEGQDLRARAEAAARRAMEIDPDNALGEMAFSVALPFVGHYLKRDRHQLRALKLDSGSYETIIYRAATLQFVGRNLEAVSFYRKLPSGPVTPADHNNLISALWSAGLIEEADREMENAASLYPTQASLWHQRFNMLLFSGNTSAALVMTRNWKEAPILSDGTEDYFIELAKARASMEAEVVDRTLGNLVDYARTSSVMAQYSIRNASMLGGIDEAFVVADAYYFNKGFKVPDFSSPGSDSSLDQRQTRILFEPVTAPMRRDARFEPMVRDLGLHDFWRQSGVQPDYRTKRH